MRAFRVSVVVSIVIVGCLGTALWSRGLQRAPADAVQAVSLAGLPIRGNFSLIDASGRTVTQDSFPGRWKLIYFGYTSCPDVCPTTLQTIATALRQLGPLAADVVPLFITIDPARDTPAGLARYTALFDPRILGLSGSQARIGAAEAAFDVYAVKTEQPGSNSYLMDHTSFVYLLDPRGRPRALFDRDVTAGAMAGKLRGLLA